MKLRFASILFLVLLAGCTRKGEVEDGGIYAIRSDCPQVEIPAGTGDITLFDPEGSTNSSAIDIEAAMTNVRGTCQDTATDVVSTATFSVVATRRDAGQPRQVLLPFFDSVVQAGDRVVAKKVGNVELNFAAGSIRAETSGQATVRVARSAAALPADVRKLLSTPRKVGEAEAAVDPMSDPKVREAVANASFAHVVGFQLTQDQLRYNVTR